MENVFARRRPELSRAKAATRKATWPGHKAKCDGERVAGKGWVRVWERKTERTRRRSESEIRGGRDQSRSGAAIDFVGSQQHTHTRSKQTAQRRKQSFRFCRSTPQPQPRGEWPSAGLQDLLTNEPRGRTTAGCDLPLRSRLRTWISRITPD